jgi:stage II sporulation protein AA (anti-sigma F factor antagonist)
MMNRGDNMYLNFKNIGQKLIVYMTGELDHHSADEVRIKVDDRLERENIIYLIMDFSGVSFMDSSGIGAVIGRYKKISARGGKVSITHVNEPIRRVFELSGLFKIINLYDSVEEAINN